MISTPLSRKTPIFRLLLGAGLVAISGCSVIIGNIKPVDEKAHNYVIANLERDAPLKWKKLTDVQMADPNSPEEDKAVSKEAYSSEVSDLAYQSKKNASIVSLNTACRSARVIEQTLPEITRSLLLGMGDVTENDQKPLQLQGVEALETTVQGRMSGQTTKVRTVVLKKDSCVYDLMYVSRPEQFPVHEEDFAAFVSSLRLR